MWHGRQLTLWNQRWRRFDSSCTLGIADVFMFVFFFHFVILWCSLFCVFYLDEWQSNAGLRYMFGCQHVIWISDNIRTTHTSDHVLF